MSRSALKKFVKKCCTNYDLTHDSCLFYRECLVCEGKACDFFEACVLPPPDYKFKHLKLEEDAKLEEKVRKEYSEINPELYGDLEERRCEMCNRLISKKKTYCPECAKERKREQNRRYARERRKNT